MNSGTTVAAAAAASSSAYGDDQHTYHQWVHNNGGGLYAGGSTDTNTSLSTNTGKKPIRRRSRVSKKTPITLLNADPASFRSLVQQFTGCPHPRPTSSISFDQTAPLQAHGPLNLDFQLGTVQPSIMQQQGRSMGTSTNHAHDYEDGDTIMRMVGGHNNLDMVQELLMVDQHHDFGFFQ
ncbi:unnamed protein product [Linum tenue]|uniref:VQ domain-containing protein n=1 Tax=Linum tenue TaxID=586396 RepID=A0AAV0IX54_9ROSI|nr:unnamed protein product [Linum tenue]